MSELAPPDGLNRMAVASMARPDVERLLRGFRLALQGHADSDPRAVPIRAWIAMVEEILADGDPHARKCRRCGRETGQCCVTPSGAVARATHKERLAP